MKTTVRWRFKGGPGSWFLLFECGHWLQWMSPIAPRKNDEMECPTCNLPTVKPA